MAEDEDHPELAEYVPGAGSSLSNPRFTRIMRIVVVVGVAALIVPGVLATLQLQVRTAAAACRIVVRGSDAAAVGSIARFDAAGAAGPSWYCYAREFDGSETLLRPLGLIPGLDPSPARS